MLLYNVAAAAINHDRVMGNTLSMSFSQMSLICLRRKARYTKQRKNTASTRKNGRAWELLNKWMQREMGSTGTMCDSNWRSGTHPMVSWSRATFTHTESTSISLWAVISATTSSSPSFTGMESSNGS